VDTSGVRTPSVRRYSSRSSRWRCLASPYRPKQRISGRAHTDYLLTDAALYHRTGTLWITVTELGLEKIQNTAYSQGVFGTAFDHGTVTVDTAGSEGPNSLCAPWTTRMTSTGSSPSTRR